MAVPYKVFYARQEGAKLDSDIIHGGGSDDTAVLQHILDQALEGVYVHLIMDGAALITGLRVHSNTKIECLTPECGFYLADNSDCPVLRNAVYSFDEIKTRNIVLEGGTYNQNCKHQKHDVPISDEVVCNNGDTRWAVVGMEFFGVEYLTIQNVRFLNHRTYAFLASNWRHVRMENIRLELIDQMYAQNQDGLHFWGKGQHLVLKNISGQSGDDFIALNVDENDLESSITDVLIDGVFFEDVDQGIRLLCRERGRLDRVIIRNVTGTYKSFGFYINAWFPPYGGNFGNIIIENVDIRQLEPVYDYTNPFLFRVGGNIECLTLRNIYVHHPIDNRPFMDLGVAFYTDDRPDFDLQNVILDGVFIQLDRALPDYHLIEVYSRVRRLSIHNLQVYNSQESAAFDGRLIHYQPGGSIEQVEICHCNVEE